MALTKVLAEIYFCFLIIFANKFIFNYFIKLIFGWNAPKCRRISHLCGAARKYAIVSFLFLSIFDTILFCPVLPMPWPHFWDSPRCFAGRRWACWKPCRRGTRQRRSAGPGLSPAAAAGACKGPGGLRGGGERSSRMEGAITSRSRLRCRGRAAPQGWGCQPPPPTIPPPTTLRCRKCRKKFLT